MPEPRALVAEAEIALSEGVDPAAVGAAVTTALCGHWEHDGPCRWPHNNVISPGAGVATFRTLFVVGPADEEPVRRRIEAALRGSPDWQLVSVRARPVDGGEQALAQRLLAGPRLTEPRQGGS